MSYLWSFASYRQQHLDALLGSQPTLSEERALAMLHWEGSGVEDPLLAAALAKHLSSVGLSYAGLAPSRVRALDGVVPLLFSPDGLEQDRALQYSQWPIRGPRVR